MGLEHHDPAARGIAIGQRFKNGPDLVGMVAIIIEDEHPPGFPFYLEAALYSRHVAQRA